MIIREMIDEMRVFCDTRDQLKTFEEKENPDLCAWTGRLQDRTSHEKVCPYLKIKCTHGGCTDMVQRRHSLDHHNTCQ